MAMTAERLVEEINAYLAATDDEENNGLWLDVAVYGGDVPDQVMRARLDDNAIVLGP